MRVRVTVGTRDASAEAALLAEVGQAFDLAGTDLRRALDDVCRLIGTWFDDLVFIRLLDDIPALSPGLSWCADPEPADRFVRYLDEGASRVLESQAEYGGMMAPLRVGGRSTGLIGVSCHARTHAHLDDDVLFLGELADRIALAAENARLVARLRNELERRSQVERRHAGLLHHA